MLLFKPGNLYWVPVILNSTCWVLAILLLPLNILKICSGNLLTYIETVWSFQVLLLRFVRCDNEVSVQSEIFIPTEVNSKKVAPCNRLLWFYCGLRTFFHVLVQTGTQTDTEGLPSSFSSLYSSLLHILWVRNFSHKASLDSSSVSPNQGHHQPLPVFPALCQSLTVS